MRKVLPARGPYDLKAVVFSHGWSDLPPFQVEALDGSLRLALRTEQHPALVSIRAQVNGLSLEGDRLDESIERDVRWMFRMDDDLAAFYLAARVSGRPWIEERRMGRLLRCQTVFEDLVKLEIGNSKKILKAKNV